MKNNKSKYTNTLISENLIGDQSHRNFLEIQVEFGIEQRGGAFPFNIIPIHITRLVDEVNLLSSQEKKQLIFSGTIFNN
ncbi:MAG: hypothetical protein Q8T03_02480 [Bacteroidota bacterium]|nr:hypothetical protein [Bacteroidota bacterium]